jgi:transposase
MRQLRDVLRLRLETGLSFRQISRGTKISVGACQQVCKKAETLGLTWPLPDDLDDSKLARLFYPTADVSASKRFHVPDWRYIHQELSKKMVTKQLLWENIRNNTRIVVIAIRSSAIFIALLPKR